MFKIPTARGFVHVIGSVTVTGCGHSAMGSVVGRGLVNDF